MVTAFGMETEAIDKLFLELSQVTKAKTQKEMRLATGVAQLSIALARVLQVNSPDEIRMMREGLSVFPGEEADRQDAIFALDVLEKHGVF